MKLKVEYKNGKLLEIDNCTTIDSLLASNQIVYFHKDKRGNTYNFITLDDIKWFEILESEENK